MVMVRGHLELCITYLGAVFLWPATDAVASKACPRIEVFYFSLLVQGFQQGFDASLKIPNLPESSTNVGSVAREGG